MSDLKSTQSMRFNPLGIAAGDTVRIRPYTEKNMHGEPYEGCMGNVVGVVTDLYSQYKFFKEPNMASIRYFEGDQERAFSCSRPLDELDIVSKGNGEFILGITQPFSKRELYEQRLEAFDAKIKATVVKWEGWDNAATHQTFLALNTTEEASRRVNAIRRKDGSVNINKLRDIFYQMGLSVADWALEPIIDVPSEFKFEIARRGWCQRIDWDSIAEEFKVLKAA